MTKQALVRCVHDASTYDSTWVALPPFWRGQLFDALAGGSPSAPKILIAKIVVYVPNIDSRH